jgi:hypothetical protein
MALIGLLDLDLYNLKKWSDWIPNLDLMCLSSYLKKEGHIVEMVYKIGAFEKYKTIYVFFNSIEADIPAVFSDNCYKNKIVYCGEAINNGRGVILPVESYKYKPDFSIYKNITKWYDLSMSARQLFKKLQRKTFIRISIDGIKLRKQFNINKFTTYVYIYDSNIVYIDGAYDFIQTLIANKHSVIIMKAPIITNEYTFFKWEPFLKKIQLANIDLSKLFADYHKIFKCQYLYGFLPNYKITTIENDTQLILKNLKYLHNNKLYIKPKLYINIPNSEYKQIYSMLGYINTNIFENLSIIKLVERSKYYNEIFNTAFKYNLPIIFFQLSGGQYMTDQQIHNEILVNFKKLSEIQNFGILNEDAIKIQKYIKMLQLNCRHRFNNDSGICEICLMKKTDE